MSADTFVRNFVHNGVPIEVEIGCTSCAFGEFDNELEPCATCYRISANGTRYSQWLLDPNYDSDDGEAPPSSSGTLPRQQRIGYVTVAEAINTLIAYSQNGDSNNWYKLILQFIIELQKRQEDDLIPAPASDMSDIELSDWLIKLQQYRTQLEQQRPPAGAVSHSQQLYLDKNKLTYQKATINVDPLPHSTMTGDEIKSIFSDEIYRLEKLQKNAFETLQKLPKTRDDAVINVVYELIPAWLKYEDTDEKIDAAYTKCQSRESKWEAANYGWTYQPPIEKPTWKDKLRDQIRSKDEKAWQTEGANLKQWRRKLNMDKDKHEQERQLYSGPRISDNSLRW